MKRSLAVSLDDRRGFLSRLLVRKDWRAIVLLVILTAIFSGLIFYRRIAFPTDNDYSTHILYAQLIVEGNITEVPDLNLAHPGLQFLLVGLHFLSGRVLGFYGLLIIVLAGTQVLTALVLYFLWFGDGGSNGDQWLRAFWSLTLSFVAPIMLLEIWDGQYYYGYIGLANYHNPTIVVLRPLALLSFLLAARIFSSERSTAKAIMASALLIVLSALIKPNYAITILIGLAGVAAIRWLNKQPLDWRMLILGFGLPAVIVLGAQWLFLYVEAGQGGEGIYLMPFKVESAFSGNLLLKFLLSILFPLSVFLFCFRDAVKKVDVQLAGLAFLAGAFQMYFLAEGGERLFHGNFRWSAQIALFLLFAVSARYLYQRMGKQNSGGVKGKYVASFLYLAHLIAGILYYLHTFFSTTYG